MARHPALSFWGLLRGGFRRTAAKRAIEFAAETLESRKLLSSLAWSAGVNLPSARADAAVLNNIYGVLVFGGSTGTGSTSSVLELSPGNTAWTAAPSLDQGVAAAGVGETFQAGPIVNTSEGPAYKYSGDIFVFGGTASNQPSKTTINYSPAPGGEGTTNAPSMLAARSAVAYATDPATGILYAIGGRGASNSVLSSAEIYNEAADQWSAIPPLPQPLYNAVGANDGAGHILVFGGDSTAGQPLSTVYRYTVATQTWDARSSMPMPLAHASAVYAAYGLIYLIGGVSTSGSVASVEAYNPVTDSWSDETPLPSPVYGASAVIDANGNVQVIGGYDSSGARVANVWTSPVGPAPVGLPVPPTIALDNTYVVYNGSPQPVTATALGTDGVTPVSGSFIITYNGSTTPPAAAGSYNLVVGFTSADPNYVNFAVDETQVIAQATPQINLIGGGTVLWNGQPHPVTATQVGIDGQTPVAGNFTITYNGSSSAPVNAGTYNVVATFTSTNPNYSNATATTTITIPDPTIPTGVTVTGATTSSIRISWNPVPVPISGYNIYQRNVAHGPKGGGGSVYYTVIASGLTGTSYILNLRGGTFAVSSVSPTGVVSTRSTDASGSALSAPSISGVLNSNGAFVAWVTAQVGQVTHATIVAYGNEYPTFSMTSGPSGMSVNSVTGVISYSPLTSDMGTDYATFQATNSVGTASITVQFQVLDLPTVQVTGGTFNFDGNTHSATAVAYGVDGVTPLVGTFTFQYAPAQYPNALSSAPYAEPGTYIVYATFTSSDPTYGGATGTGTLTILPGIPGTSGNDNITLVQDPNGEQIDWTMGTLSDRIFITDPNGLIVNGNGGTDTITLDYTYGNPLPNILHLNGTFTINGLQGSPGAPGLAGTTLEIGRSTVYISYADPSSDPIGAIVSALQDGFNNGAWNGTAGGATGAITSIPASQNFAQTTGIGYADSADGLVPGQPADTIELKYTLYGDTLLAGSVGFNDFTRLTQHYNQTSGGTWDTGDFNYDGAIDSTDLALLDRTYNTSLGSQAGTAFNAPAPAASAGSGGTARTPLPSIEVNPVPTADPATHHAQAKNHSKHRK